MGAENCAERLQFQKKFREGGDFERDGYLRIGASPRSGDILVAVFDARSAKYGTIDKREDEGGNWFGASRFEVGDRNVAAPWACAVS
jgi:hypothetical protein